MKQGDIYVVTLDPTFGREQQGTRPVLIVSHEAFNRKTGMPIILPITSGGAFARSIGFGVSLANAGIRTQGLVRCDQPRVLDIDARGGHWVGTLPAPLLTDVLKRLASAFSAGPQ